MSEPIDLTSRGIALEINEGDDPDARPGLHYRLVDANIPPNSWTLAKIKGIEQGSFGGQLVIETNAGDTTPSDTTTERLRIDKDGKVGIGTTSPSQALEVNGAVKATDFIKGTTSLVSSQWTDVAGGINLGAGNVGIGAPTPGFKLDVNGIVNATDIYKNGTPLVVSQWIDGAGGISYSGGNVGIGHTHPRTPLHVLGRIATGLDFTSAGAITFYPPDGFAWFHIDNGPAGGRPIGRLRISYGGNPGDAELMTFVQNGNVGIGTSGPSHRFHVLAPDAVGLFESSGSQAYLRLSTNEGLNNRVEITNRPGGRLTLWTAGSGDVFSISRDGQIFLGNNKSGPFVALNDDVWFSDPQNGTIHVRNGNNSNWGTLVGIFNNMSSRTYKKDITVLPDTELDKLLEDTLQTNVVTYRFKEEDKQHRLRLGVISEDSPSYVLGDDGESLSTVEYITMLHGAIKALARRLCIYESAKIGSIA
jgi:hypothetical protein